MSLMQTCADVESVVARARSLFGSSGSIDVPESTAGHLTSAAESVSVAGQRTADLSGVGIQSYREMAQQSVAPLTTGATSDTTLATHVGTAAAVSQANARRMDQIAATVNAITKAAPTASTSAEERVILSALRSQVAQVAQVVQGAQQQASALAGQIRMLEYPKDAPVHGLSTGDEPAHGKDPRYWVDVTKIIHVPDGELAPAGTKQIGPGLYYPYDDASYRVPPPPPEAKYPLDIKDITQLRPGELAPWGTKELAPGFYSPTPDSHEVLDPPWSPPQQPIDVRDIVHIPKGQLAPWGYREYLPGWWVPDRSAFGPR